MNECIYAEKMKLECVSKESNRDYEYGHYQNLGWAIFQGQCTPVAIAPR